MLAARFSRLLVVLVSAALVCAGGASADPVDANAPQIILETPAAAAFFYQGQSAQAAYACLPGQLQLPVISCVGDVPLGAPIDTGRVARIRSRSLPRTTSAPSRRSHTPIRSST